MADSDYDPPTSIRIPLDLKAAVTRRAKAEGRNFSQQVVFYLQKYIDSSPEPADRKVPKSRK